MNRRLLLFPAPFAAAIAAAAAVTVTSSPGALKSILAEHTLTADSTLVVEGSIDVRDLSALAAAHIGTLDLSRVSVAAVYSSTPLHLGRYIFDADRLPPYIFYGADIRNVILPASVKSVGEGAFAMSAIEKMTFTDGITDIGDYAMRGCPGLTEVSMPPSVRNIGKGCMSECQQLQYVDIVNTAITEIPEEMVAGCSSLMAMRIPVTVTRIHPLAFRDSYLSSVSSGQPMGTDAFALAHMDNLQYANFEVVNPGNATGLFFQSPKVTGTSLMSEIPDAAFAGSPAIDIGIYTQNASAIGDYAFYDVQYNMFTIAEGVTSIGSEAFANAPILRRILVNDLKDRIPEVDETTFAGLDQPSIMLVVANDHEDVWRQAPYWNLFDVVRASDNVDDVEADAFSIHYADATLTVRASREITAVTVCDESGRNLAVAAPHADEAAIPVTTAGGRVLIVTTAFSSGSRTDKILIP